MKIHKLFAAFALLTLLSALSFSQTKAAGGLKGKVRVEAGTPAGVAVIVRQGEREVARAETTGKGEFTISGIAPGIYTLTFRKPGLSVGTLSNVEVRAGKVRSLGDRLILSVDEGTIAFVRGSVFTPEGRSVAGARVEIARIAADGSLKKIDGRITNEIGSFSFRLPPDAATYRITVKADGAETATKDVVVDDAVVYRIALELRPVQK